MLDCNELLDICSPAKRSEEEIKGIIKEIDYQGNAKINFTEFLAATQDMKTFLSSEEGRLKLDALFQQFDTDNSGYITENNIKYAMSKLGRVMTDAEIKTTM